MDERGRICFTLTASSKVLALERQIKTTFNQGVHTMNTQSNIIGIDLAKNIMHTVEVDPTGKQIKKSKVNRKEFHSYILNLQKDSIIAMEACGSSNYWAQEITQIGLTVKLMKTKDVKAYAQSRQKNDYNDALAITKAARDPELKSVRPKTKEEQDVSTLHKMRAHTIRARVRKTNSMMSSLYEYGYVTELSKSKFCISCADEVRDAYKAGYITKETQQLLLIESNEIKALCKKEALLDKMITKRNKKNKTAKKLLQIPGIGPINASCLSVTSMDSYETPRDYAASLGLVPKQNTSGDHVVLGSITKQGDRYTRTMLIQAGRSVVIRAKINKDPKDQLTKWAKQKLSEGKHFNLVAVGVANKLARIAHSLTINDTEYKAS
jgi:transposase